MQISNGAFSYIENGKSVEKFAKLEQPATPVEPGKTYIIESDTPPGVAIKSCEFYIDLQGRDDQIAVDPEFATDVKVDFTVLTDRVHVMIVVDTIDINTWQGLRPMLRVTVKEEEPNHFIIRVREA